MRHLFAVFLLTVIPMSTSAHFIWVVPGQNARPQKVMVYFGDRLQPDKPELLKTVAHTSLSAHLREGKTADLKIVPSRSKKEGHYEVSLPKLDVSTVTGHCKWGVHTLKELGESTPFLLHYHIKAVLESAEKQSAGKSFPGMKAEIIPIFKEGILHLRVLFNGKPVPKVRVTILVPGQKKLLSYRTKRNGECRIKPSRPGIYAMWVLAGVEKTSGKHGEKNYDEVRHYATLTLAVPQKGEPK